MKKSFRVYILLWGTGRDVHVDAFTPAQAIALAKMQATPMEIKAATFEIGED